MEANQSNSSHESFSEPLPWLEQLATGDLPDAERAQLIAWLEADHTRWRQCGLAFLEAQVLQQMKPEPLVVPMVEGSAKKRRTLLAVAVTAVVAYCLGIFSGITPDAEYKQPLSEHGTNPTVASKITEPEPKTVQRLPKDYVLTLPVVDSSLPHDHWLRGNTVPARVKRQWEERGYRVSERQSLASGTLPDGRRVVFPVNHVSLKYARKGAL